MTRPARLTAEQRINRIRKDLANGLAGFQVGVGDVAALMDEYDRAVALIADTEHALQGTALYHWFATEAGRLAIPGKAAEGAM